ncbi:GNAT family protein [Aquamicrobium lusatiense]|uniref:GNAT family N-acetyltransferase n=1 Tax=Aquamicrobium lusatiense TaxID=89772 RepID=UPI002456677B|nr:GNAT family protein [Aquamicrobium lusatiense]MDH4991300.1 GNAT family protein [Aquamicrobium lusatiense]
MIVADERVARFVSGAVGHGFVPPYTCIGIERSGQVVAGVIFNCFEGSDVHFTAAGSGWTRAFLAEIGNYVFNTLKCERMTAVTEQPRVVRLAERLGGQVEGLLRNHFGKGRDAFVVGILKEDYPW